MALLLVCGCVRGAPIPIAEGPPTASVWVDAYALEGGDGSREKPLKRVPTLAGPVLLHLASGMYEGPFRLPAGTRIEGQGQAVLHAQAPAVVVEGEAFELVGVSVQGGAVGVRVTGRAALEDVHVSGAKKAAVEVVAGATLTAKSLEVVGTITESLGVQATDATVTLEGAHFVGDLRQAIRLEGGTATLSDLRSEGGKTLVHAKSVALTVTRAHAMGGMGPGIHLSGGTAHLEALWVEWHSVALNAMADATVDVKGLRSRRAHETGIVLLHAKGTLRDVEVNRPGNGGAVQLLDSDVTLEDVHIEDAQAMGVLVRKGRAKLRRLIIENVTGEASADGTRSLGDALMLRDAEVEVEDAWVRDVEGSALYASAFAKVTVGKLSCERSGGGAVFVERGAVVTAKELVSRGTLGAAVSVTEQGRLEVERLVVSGGADVPVYAACGEGAKVQVGALESALQQPAIECVRIGK